MVEGMDEDYGDFEFIIDSYKFNQERNTIEIMLAATDDPLPTKEEVKDYTQDIAWYTGSATSDKDFNVRVISVLKFAEDEYSPLGIARFKNGETTFEEDEGLEILD